MIKIAFLGVAHMHSESWALAWLQNPNAEIAGVWDKNDELAISFSEKFHINRFSTMAELLKSGIDAVGICSENYLHAEYVIAAAEAKKDILCEKPTAISLQECRDMKKAIEENNVRYMQAFPMRIDPVNYKIKEIITSGRIGKVFSFRKRHGIGWAAHGVQKKELQWFADEKQSGGGALLDEGIHAADFLIWMFGEPKSVYAVITPSVGDIGIDDNAILTIEFENGIIGTMQTSWSFAAATVSTEIFGQDGTIIQSFNDCASTLINGENNYPLQIYSKKDKYLGWDNPRMPINFKHIHEVVANTFVKCLINEEAFPSTIDDGYKALKLILAAYKSATEGRKFYLKELT